ncbi:penicillin acylase family protein [Paracoccus sp. (in: a-proteobacteria)]|uniref:penicillin acylase family protein n=1 Tax=Paracoccus sp. TaxID=267 RepID=UPI0035B044BA
MVLNDRRFGNFNRSYVYSVELHGGGFDLTGSTPFAVPGILFGTNGRIAWGATAGPLDVNDHVQLELDPDNPARHRRNGRWVDMTARAPRFFCVKGLPDVATTINWYYADKDGNIGYVSPGHLPIPAPGHDQRLPATGTAARTGRASGPSRTCPRPTTPNRAGPPTGTTVPAMARSATSRRRPGARPTAWTRSRRGWRPETG